MGAICSEARLQLRLPQLILGNKFKLTRKLLAKMAPEVPEAVHLRGQVSGWNNAATMAAYLKLLGESLQQHRAEFLLIVFAGLRDVPHDAGSCTSSAATRLASDLRAGGLREIFATTRCSLLRLLQELPEEGAREPAEGEHEWRSVHGELAPSPDPSCDDALAVYTLVIRFPQRGLSWCCCCRRARSCVAFRQHCAAALSSKQTASTQRAAVLEAAAQANEHEDHSEVRRGLELWRVSSLKSFGHAKSEPIFGPSKRRISVTLETHGRYHHQHSLMTTSAS